MIISIYRAKKKTIKIYDLAYLSLIITWDKLATYVKKQCKYFTKKFLNTLQNKSCTTFTDNLTVSVKKLL